MLHRLALLCTFTLMLTACGGGGSAGSTPPPPTDPAFTQRSQQANGEVLAIARATDTSGDVYLGGGFTTYNSSASNYIIRLNADGSIDTGFNVGTGFNDAVITLASATDGSGDVYVGGGFTTYNGGTSNRIIRLNADGSIDTGFNVGTGFNDAVITLASATDGSGDVYVGGSFSSYNGSASNSIIRLNNDGSVDTGFNVSTGFDNSVRTLAPATDGSGDVYVGGWFTSYNGSTSNRIIRLNNDGSVDTSFNVGSGFDNSVRTLAPATDGSGDVYVGGWFTSYNGSTSNRIIRLNNDGSVETGFNVGGGFNNNEVRSIAPATDGSGDVYVSGEFTSYNESLSDYNYIIRLNDDGSIDTGFNIGSGFNGYVYTLAPATDGSGDVYVGGQFSSYNGSASNRIIRLNADGSVDTGFNVGGSFNSGVNTLAPATDGSGDVYVGGDFTTYNGSTSNYIIRLNADSSVDTGLNVGSGFNNGVLTLAPATDGSGDIYVGGRFSSYNGSASNSIIRLNNDGSVDTDFSVDMGFNSSVRTLAPVTDGSGDIYVGGSFSSYNGSGGNYIIRLNNDGSIDGDFNVGSGFDNDVSTLAPVTDGSGDIYVGGSFSSYNGSASNYIIRLNNNGSIDTDFSVGTGFNSDVRTLAPATDGSGDLYVGGTFSTYNGSGSGSASNRIIRLNADGSVDTDFSVGTGFNGDVRTLAPATDGSGDIYVGGSFSSYNGSASNDILRLNADGSVDTGFNVGSGFNSDVRTLAPARDGFGDIYIGGGFTSYQTTTASHIIALNPDGSID